MAKKKPHRSSKDPTEAWGPFGWHGWQLQVPQDWNPVMFTGTHARGSAVLADLETARLELTWVSWSGKKPPNLRRSVKKQLASMTDAQARPADHWPLADRFSDAQELTSDAPEEVRLVLNSPASRRVAVVRFSPYGLKDREGVMYRVAASLADLSDQPRVPWAIYDFAFAVPQGFDLSDSKLQTGSAYLSFVRRRGELVRFVRIASAGRLSDDLGPVDLMTQLEKRARRAYVWRLDEPIVHQGHDVVVREGVRGGWSRLRRRSERRLETATWYCPACDRVFEVMRRAAHPDAELVGELTRHVVCHS